MAKQMACIESPMYLVGRHNNVEHAEVLLEAMADKDAATVHQEAQLEVGLT